MPTTACESALKCSTAHVFLWGRSCSDQYFRSSQHFEEESLVPFSLTPVWGCSFSPAACGLCLESSPAWQPAAQGELGSRIGLGTAQQATGKTEGAIRTNSTWPRHKMPAVAYLRRHLLLSAKQGPAWESSAEGLA